VTTDGRYELERFLHFRALPLRISETREIPRRINYSTTFPAFSRARQQEGDEDESASKFETGLESCLRELNLTGIGRLP